MRSLGNTCFVNASMQALLRLEPLYCVLRAHSERHQAESATTECLRCKLYRQMTLLRSGVADAKSEVSLAARGGQLGNAFAPTPLSPTVLMNAAVAVVVCGHGCCW